MVRLQEIQYLAEDEAKKISSSPRDWMGYLDTAARLYRYPFSDTMLIRAQRKDASACVSLGEWNRKVGRWVKRGAPRGQGAAGKCSLILYTHYGRHGVGRGVQKEKSMGKDSGY